MIEWIEKEFATANFGDKRLVKRMKKILEGFSKNPQASPKAAFQGCDEVIGAYRFFDNEKATVDSILQPHRDAILTRTNEYTQVLHIQDTSELDYTSKKALKGKGPLSTVNRQGFFAHNQIIVSPEGLMLGVWKTQIYARDESEHGKVEKRKQKAIEEKESYRWLEGYRDACALAEKLPHVQIISCADREGDIYEIFEEWNSSVSKGRRVAEWMIRSNQDRVLAPDTDASQKLKKTIRTQLESSPTLGTITVDIKGKEQKKKGKGGSRKKMIRTARVATLEVRLTQVTLRPPFRKGRKLQKVSFSVVMAREINPPQGEDTIDWIISTSMSVQNFMHAVHVLELYARRWEIEVFHKVLKTGCKVEELQLKEDDRTRVAVAMYMVVAWRVLYVMKMGRECPELPCDAVFEEDEWKALYFIEYGPSALATTPSLGEFIKVVAKYGGFLNRKCDGQPGPQSIWLGLIRLKDFTLFRKALRKHAPS